MVYKDQKTWEIKIQNAKNNNNGQGKKPVLVIQYKWYALWPEISGPPEAGFPEEDNIQQMDIATYRLNRPRGWLSENYAFEMLVKYI